MITIKQYDGSSVTPKDDALLYDFIINQSGIIEGGVVAHLGANQLRISAGRAIVLGRCIVIDEEQVLATVSPSGTIKGRLLIEIDINNKSEPAQFITQAAVTLPELVQEDINKSGHLYQLPLATYDVSELLITNLRTVSPTITGLMQYTNEQIAKAILPLAPKIHTHDDRYYTEAEINASISQLAPKIHTHDDRYYTEAEVNASISQLAPKVHTHDDRYYTEAEVNYLVGQRATTATYSATIGTVANQNIGVAGIVAADNPIIDVVLSGNSATDLARLEAWGSVSRIVTYNGGITVVCYEQAPTVAIPIQIKVVR